MINKKQTAPALKALRKPVRQVPYGLSVRTSGILPAHVACPSCGTALKVPAHKTDIIFVKAKLTCTCGKTVFVDSRK